MRIVDFIYFRKTKFPPMRMTGRTLAGVPTQIQDCFTDIVLVGLVWKEKRSRLAPPL